MTTNIPHWDLSNVYPGLDSSKLEEDTRKTFALIDDVEKFFSTSVASLGANSKIGTLASATGAMIEKLNTLFQLSSTVRTYIFSFVCTNSRDKAAAKKLSEFDQAGVRIQNVSSQFQSWIGRISSLLDEIIKENSSARAHAFMLKELAEQSKYLMSDAEEALAAELNLSGASAWGKQQGTITSQLSVDFELDGKIQKLPMPALINLHSHPDEDVRKRAYEAEMTAWKSVEETLAASLNGVKGAAITLNKRRGRKSALHESLDMARIDQATLDAMLSAMVDSFPNFQRYFAAKARRMGKEKLAWWDVFAPVGASGKTFNWDDAREFILSNFGSFSPQLAAFAQRAFENNWIDAEQREGKRGGAFCTGVLAVQESRILCNFDGTLDQVSTIAHELGHAFHNECSYKAGKTVLQQDTPMTLAETASIMCENIIMNALLEQTQDPQEKLAILETSLIGDAQVIVDIYSRFLFEKELFERRAAAELSADEINDIMERAQKAAYGTGLDENYLMKYMWTWKPHYYYSSLSFYNYPYAFGLLFATGLYAIYRQRGAEFIPQYTQLLASTGENSAADLAASFGIDIRTKKFWADSLEIINRKITQYENI